MMTKGVLEIVSDPDPGFYSRLFLVEKSSGGWRPVIDLSPLNKFIQQTPFRIETSNSVLLAVRKNDFLASIDLKDAYFQIPAHPSSRMLLRFVSNDTVYQFKVLCFGLSTAPQVFTRVFAAVSSWAHARGIRLLRYLDDLLILSTLRIKTRQHVDQLLSLCRSLSLVINTEKSDLSPSRSVEYLGMVIDTVSARAFHTEARIQKFLSLARKFLAQPSPPARRWQMLLGHMLSLEKLVPRSRFRMRSLQWHLKSNWSTETNPPHLPLPRSRQVDRDISWWMTRNHLFRGGGGGGTPPHPPELRLYSDSFRSGWGAHLLDHSASGLWSDQETSLHINILEMKTLFLALQTFRDVITNQRVTAMCDNSTVVAYVCKQGGTVSDSLCELTGLLLHWTETHNILLKARYLPGQSNVLADLLSCRNQVLAAEWSLLPQVAKKIIRTWGSPTIDLFVTHLNAKLPLYCSLIPDPLAVFEDAFRRLWNHLDVYAFPPFNLVDRVVARIRETPNLSMTLIAPLWPEKSWFADLLLLLTPLGTTGVGPPSMPTPLPSVPRRRSRPEPSRMETVKRLLRKSGLSRRASRQLSLYVRESTACLYPSQWLSFCGWCRGRSITPIDATIHVIVDFLIHLREDKGFSLSALKGYHSTINSVFTLKGLDLANSKELSMLFRSFAKTCSPQDLRPPAWDVALVLQSLTNQPYEPIREAEERFLAQKTLFLIALASAKRVGELHALSYSVSHSTDWKEVSFSFVPGFVAKTQDQSSFDPRFENFTVPALPKSSSSPNGRLLCPLRAVKRYLDRTAQPRPRCERLFITTGCT